MPSPSINLLAEESDEMDDEDLLVSPPPPRAPPPPPPAAAPAGGEAVSPSTSMSNSNILPATTSEEEDADGFGGIENKDIQRMHLELEDLLSDFKEQAADDDDDMSKGCQEDDVWTTPTPKNSSDRRATTGGSRSRGWDNDDGSDGHDSDDDFDDELHQLAMSEQALREELQFANDISLLGSPGFQMPFESPQRTAEDAPEQIASTSAVGDTAPIDPDAVLVGSVDEKQNTLTENEDLPRPVALEFSTTPKEVDTEQVVENQRDKNGHGLTETSLEPPIESEEQHHSSPAQEKPEAKPTTTSLKAPFTYSLQDHANSLKLRTEQQNGGWYYCDMTQFLLPDSSGRGRDTVKDYCLPVPFKKLKRLYSGLVYHNTVANSAIATSNTTADGRNQQRNSASNIPTAAVSVTAPTTPSDQVIQTPATPATKDLMASAVPPDDSNSSQTPAPDNTASTIPATPGLSFFSPPAGTAKTPTPSGTAVHDRTPQAPPPSAFRSPQPETVKQQQQQQNLSTKASRIKPQKPLPEEPLPFRTLSIRVRPDVLCGAIMDAASRALEILPTGGNGGLSGTTSSLTSPVAAEPTIVAAPPTTTTTTKSVMTSITTHVLKRQGGHLRGAVYYPNKGEDRPARAYVVDIQLCTQRNDDELQRRLIVRYYHIQDDPEALHELGNVIQQKRLEEKKQQQRQQQENEQSADRSGSYPENATTQGVSSPRSDEEDCVAHEDIAASKHLRQSCSLIQRLMALNEQNDSKNDVTEQRQRQEATWLGLRPDKCFDSESSLQRAVGAHLEANFKVCPSVREENKRAGPTIRRLTLPALSSKDWVMMDISWELTSYIVDELDTRDCSYNTLSVLRFGQFPCLPTLDVHYCSQLRRLSRENMIAHLLKSAKDLEDYASSAEYSCVLCVKLLEPMLSVYGIPPMHLPKPNPLDDYPLDYTPPQLSCPPWGNVVMEALNKVAAKTPTGDIDASEAVGMVYRAFMIQDDEEQGARLGRKNSQIMDRLANLQTLQRSMVERIRDSSVESEEAADAASDFLKRSQEAVNYEKRGFPSHVRAEVPLIDIKISLGASTSGRCYVTSNQIQFVTTSIPMLGSTTTTLFDLSAVKFYVEQNPTPTLLNPFPNTMSLVIPSTREVAYSFRPAMNPDRLMAGLTVIQSFAIEKTPSIYSPVGDHAKNTEELAAGGGIGNEEVIDGDEGEQGSLTV